MHSSKSYFNFYTSLKLVTVGLVAIGIQLNFISPTFAADVEVPLIRLVPVDHKFEASAFKLVLDDQSRLKAIRYYLESGDKKDLKLSAEVPIANLSSSPAILTKLGYDVMKLESHDMTAQSGGHLTFDYVYNGLKRQRRQFEMELSPTENGWVAKHQEADGLKVFNQMNLTMHFSWGQHVGIDSITTSMQAPATFIADMEASPSVDFGFLTSSEEVIATESVRPESRLISMLHVTSDAMDGFADLQVVVDQASDLVSIKYATTGPDENGQPNVHEVKEFNVSELANGFVIYQDSGYDIIKLQSDHFSPQSGGTIKLIYTINAPLHTRGTYKLDMVRQGDQWVFQVDGTVRNQIFLAKNTFWGKTIGIKSIKTWFESK